MTDASQQRGWVWVPLSAPSCPGTRLSISHLEQQPSFGSPLCLLSPNPIQATSDILNPRVGTPHFVQAPSVAPTLLGQGPNTSPQLSKLPCSHLLRPSFPTLHTHTLTRRMQLLPHGCLCSCHFLHWERWPPGALLTRCFLRDEALDLSRQAHLLLPSGSSAPGFCLH